MRTVPPLAHANALESFGELIKRSFTNIAGTDVDRRGWAQAALPIRAGGLGLRSVSDHSFAAYIASFKGAASPAQRIDGAFDPEEAQNLSGIQDATAGLAAKVRPEAALDLSDRVKQKKLSVLIDAKSSSDLKISQSGDRLYLQHLALQTVHGAGV